MAEIKKTKPFNHLTAITSIDGRFRGRVENLHIYFSEYAVIRGRVFVEIEYLIALLKKLNKKFNKTSENKLHKIAREFNLKDAEWVWKKDEEINHDTKAVEYFLAEKIKNTGLEKYRNYLHLGITSTDIDNTAFALSLKEFLEKLYLPKINNVIRELNKLAKEQKNLVMLARTHSKVAVPTTAGKEMKNFAVRLSVQAEKLKSIKIGSKMTGAVGNQNALVAAYPNYNWTSFFNNFLKSLGLSSYTYTTQVEPYEHKVELIQAIKRINLIIQAFDKDIWRYLALGYISLRDEKGHVGSSTMPQKINPVGFEMSESYATMANSILSALEDKLPQNRWQRDLTDKYLLRDFGQAMVMSYLSYDSAAYAIKQIGFNKGVLNNDLENHWDSIAEGIQTILRSYEVKDPYEKVKDLTRGKRVTKEDYERFINNLAIPIEAKKKLKNLSPHNYIGLSVKLAERR